MRGTPTPRSAGRSRFATGWCRTRRSSPSRAARPTTPTPGAEPSRLSLDPPILAAPRHRGSPPDADRPRSKGVHPEDARPIDPDGAHGAEASTMIGGSRLARDVHREAEQADGAAHVVLDHGAPHVGQDAAAALVADRELALPAARAADSLHVRRRREAVAGRDEQVEDRVPDRLVAGPAVEPDGAGAPVRDDPVEVGGDDGRRAPDQQVLEFGWRSFATALGGHGVPPCASTTVPGLRLDHLAQERDDGPHEYISV